MWWIVGLYVLLLGLILIVTAVVLHRTMKPLYALLRWLDAYTVGAANPPLEADTKVVEFRRLNDAARRYAARADRQKQFIGNASHEMQTPLAVCGNRLEMLVDGGSLTEEQLGEIAKVQRTLGYLVLLNRSLLLLSKIENGQFPESEPVDVNALVRSTAEDLGEIYAYRGIRFTLLEEGQLTVRMNPSLAASVVGNLLKNAFVHGDADGEIVVRVDAGSLSVANSGAGGALDGEHVFDRFYQGTKREGSTGLGPPLRHADRVRLRGGASLFHAPGCGLTRRFRNVSVSQISFVTENNEKKRVTYEIKSKTNRGLDGSVPADTRPCDLVHGAGPADYGR